MLNSLSPRLVLQLTLIALVLGNGLALRAATETATAQPVETAPVVRVTAPRSWEFGEDQVTFDNRFSAARLNECRALGSGNFLVVTRPENAPINDSAWFAFRVVSTREQNITIQLRVEGGSLRYRPKISTDGVNWVTLPAECFQQGKKGEATLKLKVGPEPLFVAAQEIVALDRFEAWERTLARLPFVARQELGKSKGGRPIHELVIASGAPQRIVTIVGRQHPPEVTGSLALMRFVETIAGDSALARQFRREFAVVVVPVVNPDGVEAGHWRHTLGGIDSNRDWGVFSQPETRVVGERIVSLRQRGRLFLHLDFHSTKEDVFYTQTDEAPASPAGFTGPWIQAIRTRLPDYEVKRSSTHNPKPVTSHNWAHNTFGIPAVTYEIGDNTDRAALQQIATVAAEEMMRRLLELKDAP